MTLLVTASNFDAAEQSVQRLVQGRYTIAEAVRALCNDEEGVDYFILIQKLREFVGKCQIPVYEPGIDASSYTPRAIRDNYEEIYWNDLNDKWLPKFDHIKWRYPAPLSCLRPDKSYWSYQYLSLEGAICLSANIAPDWIKYTNTIGRKNVSKINLGYSPRLTKALNWAQTPDCDWRYDNPSEFKMTDQVRLVEFASWVVKESSDWVIPSEFRALAKLSGIAPVDSPIKPTKSKLSWDLKPLSEIQRMPNYRAVLYQTLKKMHEEGKQNAPTAYEVLESWRNEFKHEQPKECKIWVLKTTFEFESKEGKRSIVQVKALNEAIQRLLTT